MHALHYGNRHAVLYIHCSVIHGCFLCKCPVVLEWETAVHSTDSYWFFFKETTGHWQHTILSASTSSRMTRVVVVEWWKWYVQWCQYLCFLRTYPFNQFMTSGMKLEWHFWRKNRWLRICVKSCAVIGNWFLRGTYTGYLLYMFSWWQCKNAMCVWYLLLLPSQFQCRNMKIVF